MNSAILITKKYDKNDIASENIIFHIIIDYLVVYILYFLNLSMKLESHLKVFTQG